MGSPGISETAVETIRRTDTHTNRLIHVCLVHLLCLWSVKVTAKNKQEKIFTAGNRSNSIRGLNSQCIRGNLSNVELSRGAK